MAIQAFLATQENQAILALAVTLGFQAQADFLVFQAVQVLVVILAFLGFQE